MIKGILLGLLRAAARRPLGSRPPAPLHAGPCDPSSQVPCLTVMGREDKTQCSRPLEGSRLFIPLTKQACNKGRKGSGGCSIVLHESEPMGANDAVKSPPEPRRPAAPPAPPTCEPARQNRLRGPKLRTEQAQPAQRALPGPPHAPAPRISSSRPSCPRTQAARKGLGEVRPLHMRWPGRGPSSPAVNVLAT